MSDIDLYRDMHTDGYFRGLSLLPHVEQIGDLIRRTGSKTILDYGCGAGDQYRVHKCHERWGLTESPTLYDPGTIWNVKPPGRFDGVICTDVLEHLSEKYLPAVIEEIYGYATKFVFLTISTRPARKHLPDGRNCHLTVKPPTWWMSLIGDRSIISTVVFP